MFPPLPIMMVMVGVVLLFVKKQWMKVVLNFSLMVGLLTTLSTKFPWPLLEPDEASGAWPFGSRLQGF